ncbi:MAG: serine protease [Myxococcales bacterium]|nr:serine protease [Myxococcales bacterium]
MPARAPGVRASCPRWCRSPMHWPRCVTRRAAPCMGRSPCTPMRTRARPASTPSSLHRSVVRIFATTQARDYQCPWQAEPPEHGTGSGVIIGKGQVLTGAHVVADATFLRVQKVSDPDKWVAEVTAISHDCDLALLTVREASFMHGVKPERLGTLPHLRDHVSVVGYPVGGEEVSITEGVVSRIEMQRYSHSQRNLLAVTVDAAINEGNSGGPVFNGGRVAGIAFQTLEGAENIGEMVPSNLIERFLAGVKHGRPAGVPGLGLVMQNLENPLLRKRVGLTDKQSGLLVVAVEHGSSAYGHVEVGDALLELDGHRIANNGTVQYSGRFRTGCDVLLGDHFAGDVIELQVLRKGKLLRKKLELLPFVALVPRSQYDTLPTYFVFAGLVFQPLSLDYLRTWPDWWEKAPPELIHHSHCGSRTPERQEIIVLSQVLADPISVGYEGLEQTTVVKVNGRAPRDIRDLVELLDTAKGLLEIEVSDQSIIVLDPDEARQANRRILSRYHIRADRSADLPRAKRPRARS